MTNLRELIINLGRGTNNPSFINVFSYPYQMHTLINRIVVTTTSQHISPDSNHSHTFSGGKFKAFLNLFKK